jgi:F-type H+-transporting ATPase subunit a
MSAAEHAETLTSQEYIKHHLTNLTYGQLPDGQWGFAASAEQAKEMGFWAVNVDTMGWSLFLGALFFFIFRGVAKKITSDTPTGLQNVIESAVEFVDDNVKGMFPYKNTMIGPLALTIFVWVFFMNAMDLIAVDLLPFIAQQIGVAMGADAHSVFFKVVPSTDPNITMAMAATVFLVVLFYSFTQKGVVGFAKELCMHPFSSKNMLIQALFIPVNFVLEFVNLCWRSNFYSDCHYVQCKFSIGIIRCLTTSRLGTFPYSYHCFASLYFHGVNHRVYEHGLSN